MRHSIHHKSLAAKKARILINALIDCAKAGCKPSFVTTQMLRDFASTWNAGTFTKENWRTYERASDARQAGAEAAGENWNKERHVSNMRGPLNQMYRMFFGREATLPWSGRRSSSRISAGPGHDGGRAPDEQTRLLRMAACRKSDTPRFRFPGSACGRAMQYRV